MHQRPLHAVAHEGKRESRLNVAAFQKLRSENLCQRLIAKLIQLIPEAAVAPLLLIALLGCLRNFLVRYQLYGHMISSTVSHRSSSAMRPWVFWMISNGA